MIGQSASLREIKESLLKIAATDSTVLITGETGTGKELAAELIHKSSRRCGKPFVCLNCAALPEGLAESELFGHERGAFTGAVAMRRGKFELAHGGTFFLDEIGDMNLYTQAKILRAIETKEIHRLGGREKGVSVDARIIASTNQDPEKLMDEGKFRRDLYYRLAVAQVFLPPLRDRKEDVPQLLEHYVRIFNHEFEWEVEGFTEEVLELLLQYSWPGNIRELKNMLEATYIDLPPRRIAYDDLPKPFQRRLKDLVGLPQSERTQVLSALFSTNWNKSRAAQKLHWSRMTLYRKMMKYNIISERHSEEARNQEETVPLQPTKVTD